MTDEEIDGLDPVSTSLASQATELEAQLATARAEAERLHALFVAAKSEAETLRKERDDWKQIADTHSPSAFLQLQKRTEVAEDKLARRIQYSLRLRALVVDALDITTGKKTLAFTANWAREAHATLEEKP